MKTARILSALSLMLLSVVLCGAQEQIKVIGASRVNIRAVGDPNSEIVGQVSLGDTLSATGKRKSGMVEILPPPQTIAWVYSDLISATGVAATAVRVRSGPGIGYRPIGKIDQGTKVTVKETVGDWKRIAPPSSCRVWISAAFVAPSETAEPLPTEVAPVEHAVSVAPKTNAEPVSVEAPHEPIVAHHDEVVAERVKPDVQPVHPPVHRTQKQKVVVKPSQPAQPKPSPSEVVAPRVRQQVVLKPIAKPVVAGALSENKPVVSESEIQCVEAIKRLNLVAGVAQGKKVVAVGKVIMAGFLPLRRPSSYKLLITGGYQKSKPGCYLLGKRELVIQNLKQEVRITGRKYWVRGVREPVILIDSIKPLSHTN